MNEAVETKQTTEEAKKTPKKRVRNWASVDRSCKLQTALHVKRACANVIRKMIKSAVQSDGNISVRDGKDIVQCLTQLSENIEREELEKRLEDIEKAYATKGAHLKAVKA